MKVLLPSLTPVEVLSDTGGWSYIRLPNGETRNVRSYTIREEEAKPPEKISVPVRRRRTPRSDEDPSAA